MLAITLFIVAALAAFVSVIPFRLHRQRGHRFSKAKMSVSLALAGVVSMLGIAGGVQDRISFLGFLRRAFPTSAIVLKVTPKNHNTFAYSYNVGRLNHSGASSIDWQKTRPFAGERITVYYDAANPAYSEAGNLYAAHNNDMISRIFGLGVILPIWMLLFGVPWKDGWIE